MKRKKINKPSVLISIPPFLLRSNLSIRGLKLEILLKAIFCIPSGNPFKTDKTLF